MVATHPRGANRMHLAVGMANNGDILCFSSGFYLNDGKFTGFSGHWLSKSKDRGRTWQIDRTPRVPKIIQTAIPFGRIISMGAERLAYTCYRSKGRGNPSITWLVSSEDDGKVMEQNKQIWLK